MYHDAGIAYPDHIFSQRQGNRRAWSKAGCWTRTMISSHEQTDKDAPPPAPDTAASADPPSHRSEPDPDVLMWLSVSCEDGDRSGIEEAMAELERHEYESGGGLVVWLREKVENMEYAVIVRKLAPLQQTRVWKTM